MPCQKHQHKPWPRSGVHTLVIEACETMCGWCFKEIKPPATNLRAHARRHIQNADEVTLRNITLQHRRAGRGKLAAVSIPRATGNPIDDRNTQPNPEVSTPRIEDHRVTDTQDNHELLSLKSRVDFLEGLLAQHGIEVPPQHARPSHSHLETIVPPVDFGRLELITRLVWGLDRLENCLSRINTDELVDKHPIYALVAQYTSCCVFRDVCSEESIFSPEVDAPLLKAARDLTEALCACVSGNISYPRDIGLVAAYVQLLATRWFWGMPFEMPDDRRMFLRAEKLIGGNDTSEWAMEKLLITTDVAVALVQGKNTVFPWWLDERRRRAASNTSEALELQDPSLVLIYDTIVSLIRCAGGSIFRQVSSFWRGPTSPSIVLRASDLVSAISRTIEMEMKWNSLDPRREQRLAPQTTYNDPPDVRVEERQRFLWLKASEIYARCILLRVPLRGYWRLEDFLQLRSGILEIPVSFWEGKEWMLVWIMLPLVCRLELPEGGGIDSISEKNRRYCRALFLRAAQGYAAKSWSEAVDFFVDMRGLFAWLRGDPEDLRGGVAYQLVAIGPDDEIAIEA